MNIKCFLFGIIIVAVVSSCQKIESTKIITSHEIAKLYIKYSYSLNESGMKSILCKKCSSAPYDRLHETKAEFAYAYMKKDVNFYDPDAHDFSDVDCIRLHWSDTYVELQCKGKIVLYKKDRTVHHIRNINQKVTLYLENNRFTHCPPVCSKSWNTKFN
jgi:hypothetical protein